LRISDRIAVFGLFSYLFGYVTGWKNYLPDSDHRFDVSAWWMSITNFFSDNGATPALGAAAVLVYALGRSFARYSVEILPGMFTDSRTPTALGIDSPVGVVLKTYGQLLLLIGMVLACRNLYWFCPLLAGLHCYYSWFDTAQRRYMGGFFQDPKYSPEDGHPHKRFIEKRREQVLGYLFRRHLARESGVICVAGLALVLSFATPTWLTNPTLLAYLLVIFGMLLNEAVVWTWRWRLKRNLSKITREQIEDDIARDL
jgi:hypothetical protein